ncbi:MAG: hypothetical protein GF353_06700 [Candidatus Lokiarchaeota archaeon]|nr:hypothetical protein [Candidatus Lokiarchaeota archaeon]
MKYNKKQKLLAIILYISIVVAMLITLVGTIYTIADIIMPTGKTEAFQSLSIGFQIAIIGGLLAGLFILITIFYGLFRKGIRFLLRIMFKDRHLAQKYKNRVAVQVIAGGLLISIFAVIVGIVIALLLELTGLSQNFLMILTYYSQGAIVLFVGLFVFLIIGLVFLFIFLMTNGYYLIIRIVMDLEEEEEEVKLEDD